MLVDLIGRHGSVRTVRTRQLVKRTLSTRKSLHTSPFSSGTVLAVEHPIRGGPSI